MADESAAEKTEQPTPKRLQKARDKGQVPQSQEMTSIVTILVLVASVVFLRSDLMVWMQAEIRDGMSCRSSVFADTQTFIEFINTKIVSLLLAMTPILLALTIAAAAATIAVGGLHFSPGAIEFKFDQLNPASGLRRLVNGRSVVRLLMSIAKLILVGMVTWYYLWGQIDMIAGLRWAWSSQLLAAMGQIVLGLMIRIGLALLIVALADVLYQKWKYTNDLKMTRQEVKQERKESEGAPEVKGRIRRIQFEAAARRMLQEVPKATVVLVNPTHVAVALRYESKAMDAPVMVAKGADELAERIREIARAYGVPIVSRPELARTIFATVEPGQPIPENLYVAVAEVLALIYRLRRKKR